MVMLQQQYQLLGIYNQLTSSREVQSPLSPRDESYWQNLLFDMQQESRAAQIEAATIHEYTLSSRSAADATRPIVKPGFLFPTLHNKALPRLSPQPIDMSMMIHRRIVSRNRRITRERSWREMLLHMDGEKEFDRSLSGQNHAVANGRETATPSRDGDALIQDEYDSGTTVIKTLLNEYNASSLRNFGHLESTFTPSMLARAKASKRMRPTRVAAAKRRRKLSSNLASLMDVVHSGGDVE
ncbi:hypothetical protein EMMF5_006478 [Cystobasidiomycetes sp. EMM_F5]